MSPKPKSVDNSVDKVDKAPTVYNLILGLRRIKEGNFKGLWELTQLDAQGSVLRVITDANAKATVINLAAREIGKTL